MSLVTQLRSERATINSSIQALAQIEAAGTALSAEQLAQFEQLSTQFNALTDKLARAEAAERMATTSAVPVNESAQGINGPPSNISGPFTAKPVPGANMAQMVRVLAASRGDQQIAPLVCAWHSIRNPRTIPRIPRQRKVACDCNQRYLIIILSARASCAKVNIKSGSRGNKIMNICPIGATKCKVCNWIAIPPLARVTMNKMVRACTSDVNRKSIFLPNDKRYGCRGIEPRSSGSHKFEPASVAPCVVTLARGAASRFPTSSNITGKFAVNDQLRSSSRIRPHSTSIQTQNQSVSYYRW